MAECFDCEITEFFLQSRGEQIQREEIKRKEERPKNNSSRYNASYSKTDSFLSGSRFENFSPTRNTFHLEGPILERSRTTFDSSSLSAAIKLSLFHCRIAS